MVGEASDKSLANTIPDFIEIDPRVAVKPGGLDGSGHDAIAVFLQRGVLVFSEAHESRMRRFHNHEISYAQRGL